MKVANGGRGTTGPSLRLSLSAESASVREARHAVAAFAADHGADPADVALAVSEGVSNAIIHGFRGGKQGTVEVSARVDSDSVVVTISDDGEGLAPNPTSPGLGVGLALIGSLADGVELTGRARGTTLVMRFSRLG